MRAVGLNPSLKLIKEITDWFEISGKFKYMVNNHYTKLELFLDIDRISFDQFIILLKNTWKSRNPQELRQAIDVFDPIGNGYFTIEQLKSLLLSIGEPLNEDDFKEILKTVTVQPDGTINSEGKLLFEKKRLILKYLLQDIIQVLTSDYK